MEQGYVVREVATHLQQFKEMLILMLVVDAPQVIKVAAKLHQHLIIHGAYLSLKMLLLTVQSRQSSLYKMGLQFRADTLNCQLLTT